MTGPRLVLGIETSCDETAVALVDETGRIHAERVLSQTFDHAPYGGVVPEIAARAHMVHLERLIGETLDEGGVKLPELSALAVTAGPGLIGGVIVGVMTAKALSSVHRLPLYAINHLEGHALSARIENEVPFPFLLLLVSGGHCQILRVGGVGDYVRLGATLDDALGEAFDKTAKMMGLGYPGGPAVEKLAAKGDPAEFAFPRPLLGQAGCDFSFSGLKTSVRRQIVAQAEAGTLNARAQADIAASFQQAVVDVLCDRLEHAFALTGDIRHAVVAGGVAANRCIRAALAETCSRFDTELVSPRLSLCTDNAAMIAWAAQERLLLGLEPDDLSFSPRARWPLAELNG